MYLTLPNTCFKASLVVVHLINMSLGLSKAAFLRNIPLNIIKLHFSKFFSATLETFYEKVDYVECLLIFWLGIFRLGLVWNRIVLVLLNSSFSDNLYYFGWLSENLVFDTACWYCHFDTDIAVWGLSGSDYFFFFFLTSLNQFLIIRHVIYFVFKESLSFIISILMQIFSTEWSKKNRNWSILMSSQYITLLLHPLINSVDLVSALFKHVYNFVIKFDDITI